MQGIGSRPFPYHFDFTIISFDTLFWDFMPQVYEWFSKEITLLCFILVPLPWVFERLLSTRPGDPLVF